jgi:hypothetical protein
VGLFSDRFESFFGRDSQFPANSARIESGSASLRPRQTRREEHMRGILLWAFEIQIPVIISLRVPRQLSLLT